MPRKKKEKVLTIDDLKAEVKEMTAALNEANQQAQQYQNALEQARAQAQTTGGAQQMAINLLIKLTGEDVDLQAIMNEGQEGDEEADNATVEDSDNDEEEEEPAKAKTKAAPKKEEVEEVDAEEL